MCESRYLIQLEVVNSLSQRREGLKVTIWLTSRKGWAAKAVDLVVGTAAVGLELLTAVHSLIVLGVVEDAKAAALRSRRCDGFI